jgi:uncharacterized protein YecA (UPF0149 family)
VSTKIERPEDQKRNVHIHGPNCNHGHDNSHGHGPLKPMTRIAPKIGRNDPCSCGSEKKFKKCCGK